MEAGMQSTQSTEFRTSQSTARHMPTRECSAPPQQAPDLVTVPARQGLEAVDILRRGAGDCVGPVIHDDGCDTLGFLVPPGTADAWDVPGSTCTQTQGRGSVRPLRSLPSRARAGFCLRATWNWPRTHRAPRGPRGSGAHAGGRRQLSVSAR